MMKALTAIGVAVVLAALTISYAMTAAAETESTQSSLVAECKSEAVRGHYRQLFTAQTLQHKQRMKKICGDWPTVKELERDRLLVDCLAEAQRGPMYGRSGKSDRGHVVRLKELCRSLHTQ